MLFPLSYLVFFFSGPLDLENKNGIGSPIRLFDPV